MEYRGFEIDPKTSMTYNRATRTFDLQVCAYQSVSATHAVTEEAYADDETLARVMEFIKHSLKAKIDAVLDGPDFAELYAAEKRRRDLKSFNPFH